MRELVGTCTGCGSEVYCLGGFLNGISKNGKLFCLECSEEAADLIGCNKYVKPNYAKSQKNL